MLTFLCFLRNNSAEDVIFLLRTWSNSPLMCASWVQGMLVVGSHHVWVEFGGYCSPPRELSSKVTGRHCASWVRMLRIATVWVEFGGHCLAQQNMYLIQNPYLSLDKWSIDNNECSQGWFRKGRDCWSGLFRKGRDNWVVSSMSLEISRQNFEKFLVPVL